MAKHWEQIRYSGEVTVYCRYDDDTNSWIVRAVYKNNADNVSVPDTDWFTVTKQPVNTEDAYKYAMQKGMNELVCDPNNNTIMCACSYTNAGNVHIGRFKEAWSHHDRPFMRDCKDN